MVPNGVILLGGRMNDVPVAVSEPWKVDTVLFRVKGLQVPARTLLSVSR